MVYLKVQYYEINEKDFTGVKVEVLDEQKNKITEYVNFDSEDYDSDDIWGNQEETFVLPNLEIVEQMYENNGYIKVKK